VHLEEAACAKVPGEGDGAAVDAWLGVGEEKNCPGGGDDVAELDWLDQFPGGQVGADGVRAALAS